MATIEEQSSEYRSLFEVPRPRQVRIRTVPKILLGTLPIASMLLIYFAILGLLTFLELGANLSSIFHVVFSFFASPIMIAVSIVTFGRVRRDKKLLRNGELAVGTVTYQELVRGRKSTWSQVRYRFNDASGQLYQGAGRDYSRRLRVEMTVPVFYDAKDPETNVALCTASCELKRSND